MRKWLLLLLIIMVSYVLSKLGAKKQQKKNPILKQISETITLLVWILLAAYAVAFIYWLYTVIFK